VRRRAHPPPNTVVHVQTKAAFVRALEVLEPDVAGHAIPWGARVIGATEVFDALTTSRPYQERMQPDLAIEHMRELVGTIIGAEEFKAMTAVASQRQTLVFIADDTERAYPAGTPNETLDGSALQGEPVSGTPANPAPSR
jgi:hypothetical protein